jgi:hypothetical protein
MSLNGDYQMRKEDRELLTSLHASDEATQGRPQLPAEQVERARDYLALILTAGEAEMAHIDILQESYRTKFRYPMTRWFWQGEPRPRHEPAPGFRHNRFLPAEKAQAVAERGPGVLSPDELAELLLNPYALWDLFDLIHYTFPDYWEPRLEQHAWENWQRRPHNIPIPGVDEAEVERVLKQRRKAQ